MTLLAAAEDLRVRLGLGEFSETETARAEAAIDDVSAEVLHITGAAWTDEDVPDVVRRVVLAAAKRLFANPTGLSFEQAGDYSWRIDGGAGGDILLPAERQRVKEAAGHYAVGSIIATLPDEHPLTRPTDDDLPL